jgi:hypothetical protein
MVATSTPGEVSPMSVADVRRLAVERAPAWFPAGPAAAGEPSVQVLARRPRCTLFDVRLGPGAGQRVVVKVRSDGPPGAGTDGGARPTLAPGGLTARQQAELEFAGLRRVEAEVADTDQRFAALRAIDLAPTGPALVLEHVAARTLRDVLPRWSWAAVTPAARRARRDPASPWRAAGSWLAAFHRLAWPEAEERLATRGAVVERLGAYGDHLGARPGGRAAPEVARRAARLAERVLPQRLPLAVSHGDFAPRNVFVDDAGRVVVFDPMPRWLAPPQEDVSRFLANVRLSGLQVRSQGLALSSAALDRIEREVLAGYAERPDGADGPDGPATLDGLVVFRVLVLLDRWSVLVAGGGPRAVLAGRLAAREAHRLLRAGEAA